MFTPWVTWNYVMDYFSKSESWSPTQVKVFDTLYNTNIPIIGNPWKAAADYFFGTRQADEYRNRHGITGGGHDPRKLASMSGSPVSAFSGGMNFVSRNLDMLYHDKPKKKPRTTSYEMAMDLYMMGYR